MWIEDRKKRRKKEEEIDRRGYRKKSEREKKWGNVVFGDVNPVDPWIVK